MIYGGGRYGAGALYGAPAGGGYVDGGASLGCVARLSARATSVRDGRSTRVAVGTGSARGGRLRSAAAPLAAQAAVSARGQRVRSGARPLAALAALPARPGRLRSAPAALPGMAAVAARRTVILRGPAQLAGSATAVAAPGRLRYTASALVGRGLVAPKPQRVRQGSRALPATGGLAGLPRRIVSPPSTLPGSASVPARPRVLARGRIDLVARATLAALASRTRGLVTIDLGRAFLSARPGRVRPGARTFATVAAVSGRASRILARAATVQGRALVSARRTVLYRSGFAAVGRASTTAAGRRLRFAVLTTTAEGVVQGQLERFAFSAEHARFYWDAGLGHAPVLGGEPFFARDSAAVAADRRDVLRQLIRDVARFEWVGTVDQRRQVLLLEMARSNRCAYNVDFETGSTTGWTLGGPGAAGATLTVVEDRRELHAAGLAELVPDSRVLRLDNTTGTAEAWAVSTGQTGSLGVHTASVYWRGTGSARLGVGAPTAAAAALPPGGYQRATQSQTPAATSATLTVAAAAGAEVYLVLPQLEAGSSATSPIRNPTQGVPVRLAEQFGWDSPPSPAGSATYVRWTAAMPGAGGITSPRVVEFSVTAGLAPRVAIRYTSTGLNVLLENGTAQTSTSVTAAIAAGAEVEAMLYLTPAGSGRIAVSVNRGAPVGANVAAPAGGLPSTWERLWVNGVGTANIGAGRYQQVKLVAGLPHTSDVGRMVALRGFEVNPNGEVL